MKKTLCTVLFLSSAIAAPAFALEVLNDSQLSKKTGQDGMSVSIKGDGLTGVDHIRYIDGDGFTSGSIDQSNQAGISANFVSSSGQTRQIRACATTASSSCSLSTDPLLIEIDTDGGSSSNAFLNVAVKGVAKAFYVPITSLGLVSGTNNKGTWTNNKNIVEFKDSAGNEGGIAVNMTNALSANIQLGAQPQGHMVLISGNELDIDFGTLNILSYDASGNTANSKISTKLKIDKLKFNGIGIDIDGDEGIVTNFTGDTTIKKISVNDTVFGKSGVASTTTFNGLNNASIGNISMSDVTIKNLSVSIKGL